MSILSGATSILTTTLEIVTLTKLLVILITLIIGAPFSLAYLGGIAPFAITIFQFCASAKNAIEYGWIVGLTVVGNA